ncbi:MAG: dicarboxylate/amino acid:cation symporter [Rikenellaceae bacterium]
MKKIKLSLLPRVIIAILLGILFGLFCPHWIARIFITINSLFSSFLGFIIPLLIVGLVAPGIADLGRSAGRLLAITAVLAYVFTLFSGFLTYFSCNTFLPSMLEGSTGLDVASDSAIELLPYFSIDIPPLMNVVTALILAFTIGIGVSIVKGDYIRNFISEFRDIINEVIVKIIIPILPIYIFGIFLNITLSGQVADVLEVFVKLIIVIFFMTVALLITQFSIAGAISKKNPLKLLANMLPAYMTALGTQSSAATIPVTLEQCRKNGVSEDIAAFAVPLCATIHLSGSTMKIVACSMAIMLLTGMSYDFGLYVSFIMMLGITMVAAPGVPGGAIMAALGVLGSILHFDESAIALMITLYIAMDSFGTACNVTGDGAIALIVDKIKK